MSSNNSLWLLLLLALVALVGLWLWLRRSRPEEPLDSAPRPPAEEPAALVPEPPAAVPPVAVPAAAETVAVEPAAIVEPAEPAEATASVGPLTAIGIPAAVGAPDDLRLLKGVGPKLNTLLNGLGILRYDQIAAWTPADIAKVDAHLGQFKGRIERDAWVEQARLLAAGDLEAFKARFGAISGKP